MYHTYSISEYIKEYVDNMNHYIQWIMYEPTIEKNEWFARNVVSGFFVASKVFIYTSIQGHDMEHIKAQTDKASMYFVEFYKEFGVYPGLFEFTNFDTSMFIIDKTVVDEDGKIKHVPNDTRHIYESLTLVSTIYENHLNTIVSRCLSDKSSLGIPNDRADESDPIPNNEQNNPIVSDIVDNINHKILPIMRQIIKHSLKCTDEKDIVDYIMSSRTRV
jgi:hypothetical protein